MFCKNCGAKLSDNSNFCMNCGCKVSNDLIDFNNDDITEEDWDLLKKRIEDAYNDPNNEYIIYLLLANDELEKGNHSSAVNALKKSIDLNPKNYIAYDMLGAISSNLKDYETAIKFFDASLDINPNYAQAWFDKGNALFRTYEYESSLECLDNALNLNPQECDEVLALKGMVLLKLNKIPDAKHALSQALDKNPNNEYAKKTLRYIYNKRNG